MRRTGISVKLILTTGIGLAILTFLFFNVDIERFLKVLNRIDPVYFAGIVFCILLQSFFRALRFSSIVKKAFIPIYLISAVHSFMNKILPFRTGELAWPIMMKNYLGVNYTKTISVLFFLRVMDVFCILIFLVASLLIVKNPISNVLFTTSLIFSIAIIFIIIVKINVFIGILIKIAERLGSGAIQKQTQYLIDKLKLLSEFSTTGYYYRFLFVAFALTLFVWATLYLTYFLFIQMFEIDLSFVEVVLGGSLIAFLTNLPVNGVGRLGTFELAWSAGYVLLGVDHHIAIPLGFFVNVSTLLITGMVALAGVILLNVLTSGKK